MMQSKQHKSVDNTHHAMLDDLAAESSQSAALSTVSAA